MKRKIWNALPEFMINWLMVVGILSSFKYFNFNLYIAVMLAIIISIGLRRCEYIASNKGD